MIVRGGRIHHFVGALGTVILASTISGAVRGQEAAPAAPDATATATATATAAGGNVPPPAWLITPFASVMENVTDNVREVPSGAEDDLLSEGTAGMTVAGKSRRAQVNFDGSVTYDKYLKASDLDGESYGLHGDANGELVEQLLFIDARTAIDQQPLNLAGPIATQGQTLASNQTETFNSSISPYLRHQFGNYAQGELRYTLSAADFLNANTGVATGGVPASLNSSLPGNSVTNDFSGNLQNGPHFSRLQWSLDGDYSTTAYPLSRTVDQGTGIGSLTYAIIPEFAVIGRVGLDYYDDTSIPTGGQLEPSWRIGTHLTPGPRTDLEVEAGERYGGPYWSGNLDYKLTPTLDIKASHQVSVETLQQQLNNELNALTTNQQGQLINPLTGQPTSPNTPLFNFSPQSFVEQDSDIALAGKRGRTTFSVELDYSTRQLGAVTLAQTGAETQQSFGLNGVATRELSELSSASLALSYSRDLDSLGGNTSSIWQGSLSYTLKLSKTLNGTVAYHYTDSSDEAGLGFRENLVSVGLRKEF